MLNIYCYDGDRWFEVRAADMSVAEKKTSLSSWLTTDIEQTALGIQTIDDDEYIAMQCQAICRCKLERGKAYAVVLGDKTIKCGDLIFSDNGVDKNGCKYIGFIKNGHPVWVYLGNPRLLLVPQSQN